MNNKHMSKFGLYDHVRLDPPKAQIVGITFMSGPDGVVAPFYSVLADGRRLDGLPEGHILGIDNQAQAAAAAAKVRAEQKQAVLDNVTPLTAAVDKALTDPLPGDETFGTFGAPMPDEGESVGEGVAQAEAADGFEPRS